MRERQKVSRNAAPYGRGAGSPHCNCSTKRFPSGQHSWYTDRYDQRLLEQRLRQGGPCRRASISTAHALQLSSALCPWAARGSCLERIGLSGLRASRTAVRTGARGGADLRCARVSRSSSCSSWWPSSPCSWPSCCRVCTAHASERGASSARSTSVRAHKR